jgi:adenylate cyclase
MADEGFKRKLTAILSADVEGYSRLMGDDDEATVRTLTSYREVLSTLIQRHNGKVLDSPGDNLLAEFVSVIDAVKCAVAVQKEIEARNDELPENRRMQFRIGVNLGDVIQEEGRIYGDGVNIAARLEGMAEAGGICISRTAFGQVKNKLEFGYEYLGKYSVKNISEPVHVYKVLMEADAAGKVIGEKRKTKRWGVLAIVLVILIGAGGLVGWYLYIQQSKGIEPASIQNMAYPLPDKPSIAVLPFDNMSGNPEDEYIADGITEDIITAISMIDAMFVIARNSTFTYKGKPVKVKQISEEFGIQYVLEGSIQRSGERLQVTAQLIDALTGYHLWADRYDREMKDLFDIKDEITKNIITALHIEITDGEQLRLAARGTNSLEAWIHCVKGYRYISNWSKRENNIKARYHLEQAVKIDPDFAFAWVILGGTYMVDVNLGWSENPAESFKKYLELTQKAILLDEDSPMAHDAMGRIYRRQGLFEKSIVEGEKAIALEPNNAQFYSNLSKTMHFAGKSGEAVKLMEKAMRLHPIYPTEALHMLGTYLHSAKRYKEAITAYEQVLMRHEEGYEFNPVWPNYGLTASYLELGKMENARDHFKKALTLGPDIDFIAWAKKMVSYKDKDLERLKRSFEPLRKEYAGKSIKIAQYYHTEAPAFKFEYPEGSKNLPLFDPDNPEEILRMQTPGFVEFNAYVIAIPEGMQLEDFGPKVYLPTLKSVGTNFDVISNELITLQDGAKACKTKLKWLYMDGKTWVETLLVSAIRENKLVYLTVHPTGDPEEVAWIAESLTFE